MLSRTPRRPRRPSAASARDLARVSMHLLVLLTRNPASRADALARHLRISTQTLAIALDSLERGGYIAFERYGDGRRQPGTITVLIPAADAATAPPPATIDRQVRLPDTITQAELDEAARTGLPVDPHDLHRLLTTDSARGRRHLQVLMEFAPQSFVATAQLAALLTGQRAEGLINFWIKLAEPDTWDLEWEHGGYYGGHRISATDHDSAYGALRDLHDLAATQVRAAVAQVQKDSHQ